MDEIQAKGIWRNDYGGLAEGVGVKVQVGQLSLLDSPKKEKWPVFFTVWFSKRDGDPEFQYRQEQFPCLFVEVKK